MVTDHLINAERVLAQATSSVMQLGTADATDALARIRNLVAEARHFRVCMDSFERNFAEGTITATELATLNSQARERLLKFIEG